MASVDEDLAHFGVRGMKWGVRRASKQASSDDAARVGTFKKTAKKSGTNALTTKELQDLVTRMNLEQQYARLTAKPSKLKRGMSFVNGVLSAGNTANQAIQFANSPTGKILKQQLAVKLAQRAATA